MKTHLQGLKNLKALLAVLAMVFAFVTTNAQTTIAVPAATYTTTGGSNDNNTCETMNTNSNAAIALGLTTATNAERCVKKARGWTNMAWFRYTITVPTAGDYSVQFFWSHGDNRNNRYAFISTEQIGTGNMNNDAGMFNAFNALTTTTKVLFDSDGQGTGNNWNCSPATATNSQGNITLPAGTFTFYLYPGHERHFAGVLFTLKSAPCAALALPAIYGLPSTVNTGDDNNTESSFTYGYGQVKVYGYGNRNNNLMTGNDAFGNAHSRRLTSGRTNDYVEWTNVHGETGGAFRLRVNCYDNGGTFKVTVNDTDLPATYTAVSNWGGYIDISLDASCVNSIRITKTEGGGVGVRAIEISPSTPPTCTAPTTVNNITGTNTYTVGDTPTALTASASGGSGGTIAYQWYSNTTNSNTGGTLISGATTNTYTPPKSITDAAGNKYFYYTANISSCVSVPSTVFTVTVNAAPCVLTPFSRNTSALTNSVGVRIWASWFDNGGKDCAYGKLSTDTDGNRRTGEPTGPRTHGNANTDNTSIGWTNTDDWQIYTITVPTGTYNLTSYHNGACDNPRITYEILGAVPAVSFDLITTNTGWNENWDAAGAQATSSNFTLAAGTYQVKATYKTCANYGGFKINSVSSCTAFTGSNGTLTKTVGDPNFTITGVTTNNGGTPSYSSNNTSVIAVVGGQLQVIGAGSATVTLTYPETGAICGGSLTYVITVNPTSGSSSNSCEIDGFTLVGGPYIIRNSYPGFGNQFLYDDITRRGNENSGSNPQEISFTDIGDAARIIDSNTSDNPWSALPAGDEYKWLLYSRSVGGTTYYFIKNYASNRFFNTGPFGDYYSSENAAHRSDRCSAGGCDDNIIHSRKSPSWSFCRIGFLYNVQRLPGSVYRRDCRSRESVPSGHDIPDQFR